ncbi:MAG: serine/threonine-protein kinase [Candidatus Micrarchaeota archaeon]
MPDGSDGQCNKQTRPGTLAPGHPSLGDTAPHKIGGDPAAGLLSDRYRVIEKIDEGGMGEVFSAEDTRLGKTVAIKMLPAGFAGRTDLAQRFVQEARVTAQLAHENIVDITDLVVDKPPFYVMELLQGRDIASLLRHEGRMAWDERSKVMLLQICSALAAAHENGVVHRDIKPENVFLVERRETREFVKILDFGIAKLVGESAIGGKSLQPAEAGQSHDGKITGAGVMMGTPRYMAPEQAAGENIDKRTDIYSFGVLMYEMFTGSVPFDTPGKTGAEAVLGIIQMHRSAPVVPPRQRCPEAGIPEAIEAIIMGAMQKDPENRFQDMKEVETLVSKCPAQKHIPKADLALPEDARSRLRSLEGLLRIRKEAKVGALRRLWRAIRYI